MESNVHRCVSSLQVQGVLLLVLVGFFWGRGCGVSDFSLKYSVFPLVAFLFSRNKIETSSFSSSFIRFIFFLASGFLFLWSVILKF